MPFTPLGLDHIVLGVRDQDVAQKFYTEMLGCTVDRVNARFSLIHLRFGEQLIDLVKGTGPLGGLEHFCLSIDCDDLAALAADFAARGVAVERPIQTRFGAFGDGESFFIRDPDGYLVELKPR